MPSVKERFIIFSTPMVRAILEGRKTQTRRVLKPQPDAAFGAALTADPRMWKCPYGIPGDRLWVKEEWYERFDGLGDSYFDGYVADGEKPTGRVSAVAFEAVTSGHRAKVSPLLMPKRYSRIRLEITDLGVQRVQDISEEDAKAEGIDITTGRIDAIANLETEPKNLREVYRRYWDFLNAKRGYGWDTNPFVWVIKFGVLGREKS